MHRSRGVWVFLLLFASVPALADHDTDGLPLWEAGLGIGSVYFPDYRGSDEGRTYVFPSPYFVYRGGRLRVDRRGVRGMLFDTDRVTLNISGNLGPPADSEDNAARTGMPDLDPTFEIGPSLNVRLYENAAQTRLLSLRLPLRGVIATDFSHADYIGWVFLPHLAFDFLQAGAHGWNLGISAGPIYASEKYHDYYYTVRPEFATSTRPAYDARGGYSGASVGLTFSRRFNSYWLGAFVRYDDLSETVFEDSPLVRQRHSTVAGFAVSKIFAASKERVGTKRETDLDP